MSTNLSYAAGTTEFSLLNTTIGQAFDEVTEKFPDRPGLIVSHQNIRWTFSDYRKHVDQLAAGLVKIGVRKGDRVGIWSPNCYEWSLTQFATAKIGAIMVCLNPAYRLNELEYALKKSGCHAIIAAESFKTSEYLVMLGALLPELDDCAPGELASTNFPNLKSVIRLGDAKTPGMYNFADICTESSPLDLHFLQQAAEGIEPSDPINIQFTSGTTGAPKGATLTHHNILNNGFVVGEGMSLTENDSLCIPVPLYHCFGMVLGNIAALTHGTAAVFPSEAFDPLTTLQAVQTERCTALHGVPTMFIAILELPEFASFDLTSLRTGIMAGALCPEAVMKKVIGEMHMEDILIAYGQTECSPVNHMTHASDRLEKRVSTVGRVGPHLEIKIVDHNNQIVPMNTQGEICCKGYAVMRGYWEDEEGTRNAIDTEGWLHSGDIGVMDEEGYVQITGRIKDMIIRGGENVYPKEIEDYLYGNAKIEDAQVFGLPQEKYGEEVCVWVKLRAGESMTADELKEFCHGQIAHFKIPSTIRFIEEFPMTVTGKIQKFRMRDMELESRQSS